MRHILFWVCLALTITPVRAEEPAAAKRFRERIVPVIERRCLNCHNESEKKGGLSLESAETWKTGGPGGEVVTPGDPDLSLLIELITPENGKAAMPQKADPLSAEEIQAIREWIAAGAPWPEGLALHEPRVTNTDWWSLQPLQRPAVPALPEERSAWVRNPVDAFIAARQLKLGLTPAEEADRLTLIRRVYFDLIGLPPTPEAVQAFLNDPATDAYERLVDDLLDRPQYGERWARHWLDVVHFGETHGYDKDKPRPNAWPYRDYVIRSLNTDKPYGRFVQEQIAGDVLFPGTAEGIEALGFIAAGPWDFIGHAEVPESKIDGKIARHLDRDDMVANTINTFCSLTVHCAQCHNHKFDPISQEDYYSLQAVFAALDRADKVYDRDPEIMRRRELWVAEQRTKKDQADRLERQVREQAGPEYAELEQRLAAAGNKRPEPTPPQHGYHSQIEGQPDKAKWVQVDLGESLPIARLECVACYDDFNNIGAGFGFPVRFEIAASDDPEFKAGLHTLVDQTAADVLNPQTVPQVFPVAGITARYVRMTATKLAPRQNDYIFALSEFKVFDTEGKNRAEKATVTALDSIEAPIRWGRQNLVDGIHPGPTTSPAERKQLEARRLELVQTKVAADVREQLAQARQELADVNARLQTLPPPAGTVYAGIVHYGSGTFAGTGASGGQPREIRILKRGDVRQPGDLVQPGAIEAIQALPGRFDLAADQGEGARRAALAHWLTAPENPLTWRSIVNRVWQYHFGRGLVETPNDFGRMGQLPTYPELLDWLAVEFRDEGQSLKTLHRLLVTSATYRQSSRRTDPQAETLDINNQFYWRFNRRKLEAEAIRDSLLAVAGKLDPALGGPSFRDFVIEKPEHSPHYEYRLHDANDPATHRRSIYRFLVRSQQQPFMMTLDCADPSILVDKRNQTITPLQALALLNNQLTVVMSRHFADRLQREAPDLPRQITRAFQLAISRDPTPEEQAALLEYAQANGLANVCRLVFNLNEFSFID